MQSSQNQQLTTEEKTTLEIIKSFLESVQEAIKLYKSYKPDFPKAVPDSEGFLDPKKNVYYGYHGKGLLMKINGQEIDWNFGYNGNCEGFDAWRLHRFVSTRKEKYSDYQLAEKAFQIILTKLEQKKLISKKYINFHDNLYYLV